MWERIRRFFESKSKQSDVTDSGPDLCWIPAEENPWGVRVLDVRSVTQEMLATTTQQQYAVNAISYTGIEGAEFANQVPARTDLVPTQLRYRIDTGLFDGCLFTPREMEHKWAMYYQAGKILCVRSWTRELVADAVLRIDGQFAEVESLRGSLVGEDADPGLNVRVLDYLIRSHALGLVYPVALPESLRGNDYNAAMWCMSLFGRLAQVGTFDEILFRPLEEPLRTHSLLHLAAARGDVDGVRVAVATGTPVELLALDGLAPLHWSMARESVEIPELLIELGSSVDVRSDEGATPLMTEVQSNDVAHVTFLLDRGADPNARDHRGFTALHRAAEMGHRELVEILLQRGAEPKPEAEGHTPRSLAEGRNETEIVKILDGA